MSNSGDRVWQDSKVAHNYLQGVRAAIPLASEQVEVMLRILRAREQPVRRVLDLGCGDGFLAAAVLEEWPEAFGVLADFSEPMLEAARERFAEQQDRVAIVHADYGDPNWAEALGDRTVYDAVVSGFSIHHQPDERKRALYAELFDLLAPGGFFVNVEHVSSPTPWLAEQFDEFLIDALFAYHSSIGPTTREEVARDLVKREDKQANILAPVETQCEWLRQIGFEDVDCYLKVFELAVFGGRKAA